MDKRHHMKLIHAGNYVAEVDVELVESDQSWAPYLTIEDAGKLDDVRGLLQRGDIRGAARLARVFSLSPVGVRESKAEYKTGTRRQTGKKTSGLG